MVATKAMMGSQRFPRSDDDWEDLYPLDRDWKRWQNIYLKVFAPSRCVVEPRSEGWSGRREVHAPIGGECQSLSGGVAELLAFAHRLTPEELPAVRLQVDFLPPFPVPI